MKGKERGIVLSQEKIADSIYSIWIQTESVKEAVPGQFVSICLPDRTKLLPRPLSICDINQGKRALRIVYRENGEHTGTRQLCKMQSGDAIEMISPLGKGFPIQEAADKKVLLIGGGIGIPPLLFLSKKINSREMRAALGYRDASIFLREELEKNAELHIATEDGSKGIKGTSLDAWEKSGYKPDVIFACGPVPMLRALKNKTVSQKIPCYISLEERMACGIGACLACVCKSRKKDEHSNVCSKRICKDGPVFEVSEVIF